MKKPTQAEVKQTFKEYQKCVSGDDAPLYTGLMYDKETGHIWVECFDKYDFSEKPSMIKSYDDYYSEVKNFLLRCIVKGLSLSGS